MQIINNIRDKVGGAEEQEPEPSDERALPEAFAAMPSLAWTLRMSPISDAKETDESLTLSDRTRREAASPEAE